MRLSSLPLVPPVWAAHGLTFAQQMDGAADVRVKFEPVPRRLRAPARALRHVDAGAEGCLIRVADDTRVLARAGAEIAIDAPAERPPAGISDWVLGPATVAILYQRGLTPLHASAVVFGGQTVAFLGASGAGKSSLAAAFLARGGRFMTDDVLAVTAAPGHGVTAFPGPSLLRLPAETAGRIPCGSLRGDGAMREEKWLMHPLDVSASPAPLAGLFLLAWGDSVAVERVRGGTLLARLRGLVQRPGLTAPLGAEAEVFGTLATLTREVPVWQLLRPEAGWSLSACVQAVRLTLREAGLDLGESSEDE